MKGHTKLISCSFDFHAPKIHVFIILDFPTDTRMKEFCCKLYLKNHLTSCLNETWVLLVLSSNSFEFFSFLMWPWVLRGRKHGCQCKVFSITLRHSSMKLTFLIIKTFCISTISIWLSGLGQVLLFNIKWAVFPLQYLWKEQDY